MVFFIAPSGWIFVHERKIPMYTALVYNITQAS